MNITFHIDYRTVYGEELVLNLVTTDEKGSQQVSQYRLATYNGERWMCQLNLPSTVQTIHYYYSVDCEGFTRRHEWLTEAHFARLDVKETTHYDIFDRWIDIPEDSYLYSSAMTDCINRRRLYGDKNALPPTSHTLRLVVRAPQLGAGQRLALVGSHTYLGEWDTRRAIPMTEHRFNEWVANINTTQIGQWDKPIEFKFIAIDNTAKAPVEWEEGPNRVLPSVGGIRPMVCIHQLEQAIFQMPSTKVAGTLVPVFSLRTKGSFGVGDFGDLRTMVEWVAKTGQRLLQVLPINDTTTTHTWTDSYPYSCISIFALHPQYVDLRQLPALKDKELQTKYEALRQELNALPQIDYERVNDAKTEYMRAVYAQEGGETMKSPAFKAFFKEAEAWLVPYAQYCMLRDKYQTADFSQWKGHSTWNEANRKALTNPRTKAFQEVAFYYFTQYILDSQMRAVHDFAKEKGVILKGDIPIGVSRQGCDVWTEPRYFNMNGQAGAPPDDFSVNGQNWGFPTYNWEEMLKDDCAWWVRRFQNMSKYFDAYRIDHVLGFFRIWEIPIESVHGLLGQFSPSLGLTREEIEGYGLHFQEELFTRPFIADWTLERIFKERAKEVKERFLNHLHDDIYELKAEFDTQRKIEAWFENEDQSLRDGLYALVSNVLFLRDRTDANKFHPRISAQLDFMYEALYDCDKAAFNRLYNDYYYRRNNQFWYREAMKKLPKLVQATRMLVCAEDLGMVPECVGWVMNELRILSLELQSMPKNPRVRFGDLAANPYRSVCTISSHDTPTLRMWWDEDAERTQAYYNQVLQRSGDAPHPLPGWLVREIIEQHLACPSMVCVISLQDWLAVDDHLRLRDANAERVNIPANPKHYWRYRMHLNIEDLMGCEGFTKNIQDLIEKTGR
ncbi:MAG: 4-alpha-glucanotransferase [Prevotella sp.]|nr:4-alpha-glucanotransferase [Prevotella sp.]